MNCYFFSSKLCSKGYFTAFHKRRGSALLPITVFHCQKTPTKSSLETLRKNWRKESNYILILLRSNGIKYFYKNTCLVTGDSKCLNIYSRNELALLLALTMLSGCRRFLLARTGDSKSLSFITYVNRNKYNCKEDFGFGVWFGILLFIFFLFFC